MSLIDFLSFHSFISIKALIVFYYIGAVIMPIGLWFLLVWLIRKYEFLTVTYQHGIELLWNSLKTRQKVKLSAAFIITFLFAELFWRMLFEFLIAYMQMRDAILQLPVH